MRKYLAIMMLPLTLIACALNPVVIDNSPPVSSSTTGGSTTGSTNDSAPPANVGETGRVTRVIDGDTIDVEINGETIRIRYLQINTTEKNRGESCSQEGTDANAALVAGQIVRLVADQEATDQYDRWLRHVYVGDLHVNAELVRQGWAEAVVYEPNDAFWEAFIALEQEAAAAGRGCHGISDMFDDGNYRR